jgi:hypothetical protein
MKTLLLACAGLLALSGAVAAQDLNTGHLAALDTSGDGTVDADEFNAFVVTAFGNLDANGDGFVSVTESGGIISPEQFAAADTNGDSGLSQAEFETIATADFAAADRNGNGVLD